MDPITPISQGSARRHSMPMVPRTPTVDPSNEYLWTQLHLEVLRFRTETLQKPRGVPVGPEARIEASDKLEPRPDVLEAAAALDAFRRDFPDGPHLSYSDLTKMHFPLEAEIFPLSYWRRYYGAPPPDSRGDDPYDFFERCLDFPDGLQSGSDEQRHFFFLKDARELLKGIVNFPWPRGTLSMNKRYRALLLLCRVLGPHDRPSTSNLLACPPLDYFNGLSRKYRRLLPAFLQEIGEGLFSPNFRSGHSSLETIVNQYHKAVAQVAHWSLPVSWTEFARSGALSTVMTHYLDKFSMMQLLDFLSSGAEQMEEVPEIRTNKYSLHIRRNGNHIELYPFHNSSGPVRNNAWVLKHLFFFIASGTPRNRFRADYHGGGIPMVSHEIRPIAQQWPILNAPTIVASSS
jgi:hypothetical protein